jgi:hypothetical protein
MDWERIVFDPTPQMTPSASLSILTNLVSSISNQSMSAMGRRPSQNKLDEEIDHSTQSLNDSPKHDTSFELLDASMEKPGKKNKFSFGKIKKVFKKISSSKEANLDKQSNENPSNPSMHDITTNTTPATMAAHTEALESEAQGPNQPENNENTPHTSNDPSPTIQQVAILSKDNESSQRPTENVSIIPPSYTIFVSISHITIYDRLSKERLNKEKFDVKAMRAILLSTYFNINGCSEINTPPVR